MDLLEPAAPIDGAARTSPYSTYEGSLTTPTCNEGESRSPSYQVLFRSLVINVELLKIIPFLVVEWINFLQPLKISRAQLAAFRMLDDDNMKDIVDNFRPPQPLNGRTVNFWN